MTIYAEAGGIGVEPEIGSPPRHAGLINTESRGPGPGARICHRAEAGTGVEARGASSARVALSSAASPGKSWALGLGLEGHRNWARGKVLSLNGKRSRAA